MMRARARISRRARAALLVLALAVPGAAGAADLATDAQAAAGQLDAASAALGKAEGARNRVKALTGVIRAYEQGLQAMREGLRRAALAEARLTAQLHAGEGETARLLGVLQSISATPAPVLLLHPSGPLGTARAGMIVQDVTPALESRVTDLRQRLQQVSVLRTLQQSAADKVQQGLEQVQRARTELSQAIADRKALPRRFSQDPVKTALLIASSETLSGFASGLSRITVDEVPGSLPGIADRKGHLPWPVEGRILRHANEADAAGVKRPGVVMSTRPRALVTTPVPATVRYRGPLLDYGNVIILEPQAGLLLVLAGLDTVYGHAGEVLPGGSPVGLMGGEGEDRGLLRADASAQDAQNTQTLYIELRQDNTLVDPEAWFTTNKEE